MRNFRQSRCALRQVVPGWMLCLVAVTYVTCGLPSVSLAVKATAKPAEASLGLPLAMGVRAENEAKIYHALDEEQTHLEFVDEPLVRVTYYLRDLHGVQIVIDAAALKQIGLTPDVLITVRLSGLSLRSALHLILEQHDLTFVVRHGVLFITTEDRAAELREVRIYTVGDLLEQLPVADDEAQAAQSAETLIEIITNCVDPQSWSDGTGPGPIRVFGDSLVIYQTHQAHDQIRRLLSALRSLAE